MGGALEGQRSQDRYGWRFSNAPCLGPCARQAIWLACTHRSPRSAHRDNRARRATRATRTIWNTRTSRAIRTPPARRSTARRTYRVQRTLLYQADSNLHAFSANR